MTLTYTPARITRLQYRIFDVWPGTQRALASATGINQGRISQYASGSWPRPIPAKHLLILARVLCCNPIDLVGSVVLEMV